jgi:hypothetical protein
MQTTDSVVGNRRGIPFIAAALATICAIGLLFAGCTVYQPAPYYVSAPTGGFDRSWSAVVGAMVDEGVRIKAEDRSSGTVHGTYDNIDVRSVVRTQADGSVRVEFNTSGDTSRDSTLIDRISRSYDRRMGR